MAANDYDDLPSFANYLQFNEETAKYDDLASFANFLQSNEETAKYDDLASFANFLQLNEETDLASLAANLEANSFALLDDEESDAKYSSRPLPLTAMTETQKKKLKKIEKAEKKKQKKIKKAEKKKQKKKDQQSQNEVRTDNGRGRGCEGPVSARSSLNEQDGKLTGNKQHGKEQGVKQVEENVKPNGNKQQGNEQGLKHVEEPIRVDRDVELVNEVAVFNGGDNKLGGFNGHETRGRVLCSGRDIPLESNGQEVGSGGSEEENWTEVEFAGNKRKSSSANSMFK